VESIDFGLALGDKGCVLFDGVWMVTINPEDWIVYAVSDRVSPRILGQLHRPPHAERAQSGVVKSGGTADIRDSNASVIYHPPLSCGSRSSRPPRVAPVRVPFASRTMLSNRALNYRGMQRQRAVWAFP
jgi:hypothetical protein